MNARGALMKVVVNEEEGERFLGVKMLDEMKEVGR